MVDRTLERRIGAREGRAATGDRLSCSILPGGESVRRPSLSSLAADKTNKICTKVDVKCSHQISLIQIMISNLDPLLSSKLDTNNRVIQ